MKGKLKKLYALMKRMKRNVLEFNRMVNIVFGILRLRIVQPKALKVVMMHQIQLKYIVKVHHVNGMNLLKNALIYLVIYSKERVHAIYILTLT